MPGGVERGSLWETKFGNSPWDAVPLAALSVTAKSLGLHRLTHECGAGPRVLRGKQPAEKRNVRSKG